MSNFLDGMATPGGRTMVLFVLMLIGAVLCLLNVAFGLEMVKATFYVFLALLDPRHISGDANGKV